MFLGQVWSKADCDGNDIQGHQGGRGSAFAVTAHTPGADGFYDGVDDVISLINDPRGETTVDTGNALTDRVRGFNAMHTGGLNFARCDGSMNFVRETIDLRAYRDLSTINGGEVISADDF